MRSHCNANSFVLAIVALIGAIAPGSGLCEESEFLKLGGIFCLTGEIAPGCNAIREGAEIAVEEINKAGGIDGRSLILDIQDSQYTPKGAHTLAVRFASDSEVRGVLVTGIVETKSAAGPLEKARIPYLTLWDSAPAIEALGEYSFGIGPWLPSSYEVAAEYSLLTLGKRKAAVVATVAEWSQSVAHGFEDHFRRLGGIVSKSVSTLPDETDFRTVLLQVLADRPEVIYAPVTANLLVFFRQLRQLGFTGPVITSDNLTEDLLSQDIGAFEGVYQTMVTDPTTGEAEHLATLYEKKFHRKPTMLVFHGWGYDGVHLMAHALRNSDRTPKGVKEALLAVRDFPGAGGKITFSPEGSWRMPLKVLKVEKGKFVPVMNGSAPQK